MSNHETHKKEETEETEETEKTQLKIKTNETKDKNKVKGKT